MKDYDFQGWATKNKLKCSDGRVIMKDAFKVNDGQTVPLVWNHRHDDPFNVLGHALLENRPEGVYAYCTFNDSEQGLAARKLVQHGDVSALSIYANQLRHNGSNVVHGKICEVSLVLAGANPGAYIDSVLTHGEDEYIDEEGTIYTGENIVLSHADNENDKEETDMDEKKKNPENEDETIGDIWDALSEKQKNAVLLHRLWKTQRKTVTEMKITIKKKREEMIL